MAAQDYRHDIAAEPIALLIELSQSAPSFPPRAPIGDFHGAGDRDRLDNIADTRYR
jgi:hypothetical protein